jgi:hypothetical protein
MESKSSKYALYSSYAHHFLNQNLTMKLLRVLVPTALAFPMMKQETHDAQAEVIALPIVIVAEPIAETVEA